MSDIENNLEQILKATYGKDVRQSIHDAIHDCYEDGKAGSTDLVARERISALVNAEGGNRDETVLYSVSSSAWLPLATIGLSEPIANFDYLEFYYGITDSDNFSIKRVGAVENTYTFNFFNIVDADTKGVNAFEMNIRVDADSVFIKSNFAWAWDGSASSNATKVNASSDDPTHFGIKKIVGIKFKEDTELADVRIGEDGTTYATAGDAVRNQISDLKSQINSSVILVEGTSLIINTNVENGNEVSF